MGRGGIFSILLDKKTIYYYFEKRLVPGPLTLASASSGLLARNAIGAPPLARKASRELWSADGCVSPGQTSPGASTRHAPSPLRASVSIPVNEALVSSVPGVSTIGRKLDQDLQLFEGARDSLRARPWSGSVPVILDCPRLMVEERGKHGPVHLREPGGGLELRLGRAPRRKRPRSWELKGQEGRREF